jgi:hypothetical protein
MSSALFSSHTSCSFEAMPALSLSSFSEHQLFLLALGADGAADTGSGSVLRSDGASVRPEEGEEKNKKLLAYVSTGGV